MKRLISLLLLLAALSSVASAQDPLSFGPGTVVRLAAYNPTITKWVPFLLAGISVLPDPLSFGPGTVGRMAYYNPSTKKWVAWQGTLAASNLTGGNWKVLYSNGTGTYQELSLGAAGTFLQSNGAALAPSFVPAVAGGVTSVGLGLPVSVFSISGSPVVTTGTLTGAFINQTANTFFSGPSTGVPATPTFRAMTWADLPQAVKDSIALKLAIIRFTTDSGKVWDSLAQKLKITRFTTDSSKVWDSLAQKLGITRFTLDSIAAWLAINRKIDTNGTFTNIHGKSVKADDSLSTDSLVTRVAELKQGGYIWGEDTLGGLSARFAVDIAGYASLGVIKGNAYQTENGSGIWVDDTLGSRRYQKGFGSKITLTDYGTATAWGVRSTSLLPTPAPYIHWKIVYPTDSSEVRFNRDSMLTDVPFWFMKAGNYFANRASGIVDLYDTVGVHTLGGFPRHNAYYWATFTGLQTPGSWTMNRLMLEDFGGAQHLDMIWTGTKVEVSGDSIYFRNPKTDIDNLYCKPPAGTFDPDSALYINNGRVKKGASSVVMEQTGVTTFTANYRKAVAITMFPLGAASIATASFNVPTVFACSLKIGGAIGDSLIIRTYNMITLGVWDTTATTGTCAWRVRR